VGKAQDWSSNDRIRREGTQNLLAACAANGVGRYVQQSIALLYGDTGDKVVDESHPLHPTSFIQSAIDMEDTVKSSVLGWCILRGGLLYGPGTWREEGWRQAARDGSLRWPGSGDSYLSLIHVVDLAHAIVCAVELAKPGSVYNVVDDKPVTYKQLYGYIAASVKGPVPSTGGEPGMPSQRCSNKKIRSELDWAPFYSTYLSGLAD
jgi:nucleoside-diphosphate-sugar epimerase